RLKKYFCWVERPDGRNIKLTKDQLENGEIPEGRRFALNPVINPNPNRPRLTYEFLGFTKVWKYTKEKMQHYHEKGMVFQPSEGALPQKKQYLDESSGMKLNDIFLDIGGVMGGSTERLDFDTQKPLKLLQRLVQVSSNPNDLVADFFCGSGTTLEAAASLGRRWIGCELSLPGIQNTRKRLVVSCQAKHGSEDEPASDPEQPGFSIWIARDRIAAAWLGDEYIAIILNLLGASPLDAASGSSGRKEGRLVHVIPPGTVASLDLAGKVIASTRGAAEPLDILAGEWELGFEENPGLLGKKHNRDVRLVQIPSINEIKARIVGTSIMLCDLMAGNDTFQQLKSVPFFEIPDIEIHAKVEKTVIELSVLGYRVPVAMPAERGGRIVREGLDLIDFVAIDWNPEADLFKPSWYYVKSKKDHALEIKARHEFKNPGTYHVQMRVTDVFGHYSKRQGRFVVPRK
nr:site-specific DNA-methyltransferase [Candidatus Sigynarchaeota archaeon]